MKKDTTDEQDDFAKRMETLQNKPSAQSQRVEKNIGNTGTNTYNSYDNIKPESLNLDYYQNDKDFFEEQSNLLLTQLDELIAKMHNNINQKYTLQQENDYKSPNIDIRKKSNFLKKNDVIRNKSKQNTKSVNTNSEKNININNSPQSQINFNEDIRTNIINKQEKGTQKIKKQYIVGERLDKIINNNNNLRNENSLDLDNSNANEWKFFYN